MNSGCLPFVGLEENIATQTQELNVTQSFIIAVVVLWLQGVFVPSILFLGTRDLGPKPMNWVFAGCCIAGGVSAFVLHSKLSLPFSPIIWTVFGMWATYLPGYHLHAAISGGAKDLVRFAPQVASVGLAEFDRIDVRGKGDITAGDIFAAIDEGRVDQQNHEVLRHMASNVATIGHVVQVFPSAIPEATYPAMLHAISRADLSRHQNWVTENLAAWH